MTRMKVFGRAMLCLGLAAAPSGCATPHPPSDTIERVPLADLTPAPVPARATLRSAAFSADPPPVVTSRSVPTD